MTKTEDLKQKTENKKIYSSHFESLFYWNRLSGKPKCEGYSLLELLIATFILAFILLSTALVGNAAIVQTYNAYLSSAADIQLINISERFCAGVGTKEFTAWQNENIRLLPNSTSSYTSDAAANYHTELCWQARSTKKRCLST